MRVAFLLLVIGFVACFYLAQAASAVEEEPAPAPDREAALLDVDAGVGHENESPREARGHYGRRYGRYRGYGHHGYGHRYGRGYGRYYG